MGFYKDTGKWTLVNNFTIERDEHLKDRPFMVTCVPQRIVLNLTEFFAVASAQWNSHDSNENSVDDAGKISSSGRTTGPKRHKTSNYMYGSGDIKDSIVVFSMEDGEEQRFEKIEHVRISPLPLGYVGGKHASTTLDAIGFSGMSSRKVPDEGLMEGEPGVLFMHEGLQLEVHLEEAAFSELFDKVTQIQVKDAKIVLEFVAELFEDEVQASLSEPWYSHEYGMLRRDSHSASARARLETLSVAFGSPSAKLLTSDSGEAIHREQDNVSEVSTPVSATVQILRGINRRINWVVALLGIIGVLLLVGGLS